MGFVEANERGFSRMFDFSGRATRAEFWWFSLTGGLVAVILVTTLAALLLGVVAESIILLAFWIGIFPLLSIQWRRMHDIGLSGSWILAALALGLLQNIFIDASMSIIFLYLLGFKRGDAYTNNFGPSPISFDEHSSSNKSTASQIGVPADSETDAPADILDHLIEIEKLKQQTGTPVPQNLSTTEAKFFAKALAELESGKRDSGIWAKAYAQTSDEGSAKRLYVRLRAEALELENDEKGTFLGGLFSYIWSVIVYSLFGLLVIFILIIVFD